ncbi:MAG: hypothetical protein KGZ65_03500, partial [Sphingomonadales bacterium]|nr:hypothetical protein [Sphingomonadales bacterium]
MIAGRFRRTVSPLALNVLALPLALLVPLASPFSAQQAASLGLPQSAASLGAASAATAKPKKKALRKPAATKRVCSKVKVKGKLVTRCKTVKVVPKPVVVPPPVVVTTMPPVPAPVPVMEPVYVAPPPPPPPPQAAPAVPAAAFFWIDQADSYAQVLGDSPPDFTFRYNGIDCWAWVSRAGEVLIVEPGQEGVVQYYFAVRETAPYLVRDSYHSYAFDGRELVQVYDQRGRIWTSALTSRQRYDSHDLRERGRALYAAAMRTRQWDASTAFAWSSWS